MSVRVYEYKKCSTCQRALKYLAANGIAYEDFPIVEQPPTITELKQMLKWIQADGGSIKNLFNTSGEQYRALKISDKFKAGLTETQALDLLSKNGKLIKRPFFITHKGGTVGFKEEAWEKLVEELKK